MSEDPFFVHNTLLDTSLNTDGSERIRIQRCTSAPAILLTAYLDNHRDDRSFLNSGHLSILLAHVAATQDAEERTRRALCEMQELNSLLEAQVRVTSQRCYVTTIILRLISDDGSVSLHQTWRTFYSCCAGHLRISIPQLMYRIYGALVVNNLRRLRVLCNRMEHSIPLCIHDIQAILDALACQVPMQILILEQRRRFRRVRLVTPELPCISCPFVAGVNLLPFLWSTTPMVVLHPGHEDSYALVRNLFG